MKTATIKFKAAILFLVILAVTANAQITIRLKPKNGTGKDNQVGSATPDTIGNWKYQALGTVTWTCNSVVCIGRGFIQFDISTIPTNAYIISASLKLFANKTDVKNGILGQPTYGSSNAGWLRPLVQSWVDSTLTWKNQPSYTTLNQVAIPQSTNTAQDYTLDVTSSVQSMVSNPATNFGWMLMMQNEVTYYNSLIFASSDHPDTSLAPELIVTYSVPFSGCVELKCKEDVYVNSYQPDAIANPSASILGALTWTCNSTPCNDHGFIYFDLNSIPSNAIIDSALLYLFGDPQDPFGHSCFQNCSAQSNEGWLRQVVDSWNENTMTWNNQPGFSTTNQISIPASTNRNENYWLNVTLMVSSMVKNPATNFGFTLMMKDEVNYYQSLLFASSNNSDTTLHPRLKVCYTVPTGLSAAQKTSSLKLFPNPSNGKITLSMGEDVHGIAEIYNSLGEQVFSTVINSSETTLESNFKPGIYFVKVRSAGKLWVAKAVVE